MGQMTLQGMAGLTELFLSGRPVHRRSLALELGVSPATVYNVLSGLVQSGGWHTPVAYVSCAHCGEPLVIPARDTERRCTHPHCRPAYLAAQVALRPHRSPSQKDRERRHYRQKAKWASATLEEKAASFAKFKAANARLQALTAEKATKIGTTWTPEEDAYLLANPDMPDWKAALALGRTLHAVQSRVLSLRRRYSASQPAIPAAEGSSSSVVKGTFVQRLQQSDGSSSSEGLDARRPAVPVAAAAS